MEDHPVGSETRIAIHAETDIVSARHKARELAASLAFSNLDQTLLATAVSELVRNIVVYAKDGEVLFDVIEVGGRQGVRVVVRDQGPGIADPALAMRDGYSTTNSLGMGLPGAKRLVDEFTLATQAGKGTTVTMVKWQGRAS